MTSRAATLLLGLWVGLVLVFLFGPIALIAVYAFNASNIQSWPIAGLSTQWFGATLADREVRAALALSLEAGAVATAIAVEGARAAALEAVREEYGLNRPVAVQSLAWLAALLRGSDVEEALRRATSAPILGERFG